MGPALHTGGKSVTLQEMPEGVFFSAAWTGADRGHKPSLSYDAKSRGRQDGQQCDLLRSLVLKSVHDLVNGLSCQVQEGMMEADSESGSPRISSVPRSSH